MQHELEGKTKPETMPAKVKGEHGENRNPVYHVKVREFNLIHWTKFHPMNDIACYTGVFYFHSQGLCVFANQFYEKFATFEKPNLRKLNLLQIRFTSTSSRYNSNRFYDLRFYQDDITL